MGGIAKSALNSSRSVVARVKNVVPITGSNLHTSNQLVSMEWDAVTMNEFLMFCNIRMLIGCSVAGVIVNSMLTFK